MPSPAPVLAYPVRTDFGRPSSAMRSKAWSAIAALTRLSLWMSERADRTSVVPSRISSSWRTVNDSAAPWLMWQGRLRSTGDAGNIAPSLEGTGTGGTVIVGGQEVATELEEVVDLAVAGEEPLGVARRLEPLHVPFSPSRRLVRDLGPVVEVAALAMLDPRQDLPLGRAIAAQLVGHDHTGHVVQPLQQLLEEAPGRLGVAPALDQDVEQGAVLVARPPQVVQLAADAEEHLIQVPLVARPWPTPLERVGEGSPEPETPGADALVAHYDAALGQDRLDVAQAQAEAVVEPHRVADDLGREAEAMVGAGLGLHAHQPATPLQPWPS